MPTKTLVNGEAPVFIKLLLECSNFTKRCGGNLLKAPVVYFVSYPFHLLNILRHLSSETTPYYGM